MKDKNTLSRVGLDSRSVRDWIGYCLGLPGKWKLITSLLLLLTLGIGQMWAANGAIYATSFEDSPSIWKKNGGTAGVNTVEHRTGTKAGWHKPGSANSDKRVDLSGFSINFGKNEYAHLIFYAKSRATFTTFKYSLYLGSAQGEVTAETKPSSSEWTRYTTKATKSTAYTSLSAYFTSKISSASDSVYFDDIIVYVTSSNDKTDLKKPGSATITTHSSEELAWETGTDASDDNNGATGVQKTLIFKRTSGTTDGLSLNDQGIYSLTSSEGPNKDQSGNWTLVAVVNSSVESYTTGLAAGDRYAIVHRDLAYNYSNPVYTTITASCNEPTTAFANGSYTVDGTPLTLSSLISNSQGDGAISYEVTDANGTGASISEGAFTATNAGTATVTATQAADATNGYCQKVMEATITVSPAGAVESNITYTETKGATNTNPAKYTEGTGIASFDALADVTDFHFTGWSPASIAADATGDKEITAQWVAAYNVTFSAGTGSGTVPAGFQKWEGGTFNLPGQGNMTAPTGKAFDGWKANGAGDKLAANAEYTMGDAAVEFVAQWKNLPQTIFYYQSNVSENPALNATLTGTGGTLTTRSYKTSEQGSFTAQNISNYATGTPDDMKVASGKKAIKMNNNDVYLKLALTSGKLQTGDTIVMCGYGTIKMYKSITSGKGYNDEVCSLSMPGSTSSFGVNTTVCVIPQVENEDVEYDSLCLTRSSNGYLAAIKIIRPAQKEVLSTVVELTGASINDVALTSSEFATLTTADAYLFESTSSFAEAPTIKFNTKTTVTYDEGDPKVTNAEVPVTATLVSGKWQAQKELNSITYTVKALKTLSTDATLSDLTVNGTTVTGFATATEEYNVVLPFGTTTIPTVAGTANSGSAKSVVHTQATALPGSATVVVTAEDNSTKTYTINFTVDDSKDLLLAWNTGVDFCSGADNLTSAVKSDDASVSTYINKVTFTNVEGSGDDGAEGGSLNVGKKAGNMLTLSAKAGYALKAMAFAAKIQDATCEYSLDGEDWQTLTSTSTSGDACYTIFSNTEVREFRLRSTGASGVWIRNMELTIKEKCTPVTLAWTAEPEAEYEITTTQPDGIAAVANNGTVTYQSTNTDVIEVDADGDLTLKALGTTTLKATAPAADGKIYCSDVDPLTKEVTTYYLVTFDPDNGEATTPIKYYAGDAAIALPATDPEKENHTFQGWFIGDDKVTTAITPSASVVVKAKWATSYVARLESEYYTSLPAAVTAATDGQTVYLLKDVTAGPGVMIAKADAKQITIDLGGFTYCATSPGVGSTGTQNQAFHFEKGCDITLQNGTVTSSGDVILMLIQNYGDLELIDVTLDGSGLPGSHRYVLSNNCGDVVIGDGTTITAKDGDVAFDVCATNYYPEGTTVTVKDGATITGIVEYDVWGTKPADNKAELAIEGGNLNITWNVEAALAEDAKDNLNVSGGSFTAAVPNDYCATGFVPTAADPNTGKFTVEPKAPLMLVKVVLEAGDSKASIASKTGTFKDDENIKINVAKDLKLSNTGNYVKVAIDGAMFQDGDSVVIELASGKNVPAKLQLFADAGTTMIAEAEHTTANPIVVGDNSLIVSNVPANSTEMYIYRTEAAGGNMNPYVQSMAVYRTYLKPVLETISINGVAATAGANNTFSAKLPNGTNLEGVVTIVEKVMSNDPANTHGAIQGSWAWGANTYRVTDADGDYTDYAITLTEVAAIASVEISGTLTVEELAATTLSALVKDVNGDDAEIQDVTWTTDNAAVATVVNGVVTGVAAGTAHITATSSADNSKFATVEVTVTELPCRTWNAPSASFSDATISAGKLRIVKGDCTINNAYLYEENETQVQGYCYKVDGSNKFIQLNYADGAQFESLELGLTSSSNGSSPKYVVVIAADAAFTNVLSATEYTANAKDGEKTYKTITLPENGGARYVRIYRSYNSLGNGTSVSLYHVYACKKELVALTSVAVADKTMAVGLAGTPAVTLTPANADVNSYAWEIVNDGTGAATINPTTGAVSSTATGVVTVKVTATDALNNEIVSNVAAINIVNKFFEVVPVTATQEWNWAPVSVDANGPTIAAPDTVLANYLFGDEWKMLAGANGDRPYRDNNSNKAFQGYKLSMKTTAPGMLTINARYASSATVYLKVNGNTIATLDGDATDYSVAVPSGDVIITADGSQPMRIYWMKFDTDLASYNITANAFGGYTRDVTIDRMGTVCVDHNVPAGCIVGAEVYKLLYWKYGTSYQDCQMVDFEQVNEMKAGEPYMIIPTATKFKVFYGNIHVDEPKHMPNGFIGTFDPIAQADDNVLVGKYGVVNNQIRLLGPGAYSPANRAYIDLSETPSKEEYEAQNPNPAPARRISLGRQGEQVATGLDAINVDVEKVEKIMIDGQMYILRGGHVYDATGRLVK